MRWVAKKRDITCEILLHPESNEKLVFAWKLLVITRVVLMSWQFKMEATVTQCNIFIPRLTLELIWRGKLDFLYGASRQRNFSLQCMLVRYMIGFWDKYLFFQLFAIWFLPYSVKCSVCITHTLGCYYISCHTLGVWAVFWSKVIITTWHFNSQFFAFYLMV